MNPVDATKRHSAIYLAGFRSRAVAIGMVQLIKELSASGALDSSAVDRIKDAVADELTVARPLGQAADEFREDVKAKLDRLLQPEEGTSDH